MSYRERFARPPTPVDNENYKLQATYRQVFSTPEGQRVLDDICQRLCGLDAVVTYSDPVQAVAIVERQNVAKQIARLALGTIVDDKPKRTA